MSKRQKILDLFIAFFSCILLFLLFTSFVLAATAKLTWTANTESDLAGYKVYWGTSPRTGNSAPGGYPNSQDVINATTFTANNISDTGTTYFSLTAKDTSENESGFSTEVKKTPGDINKDGKVNMLDFQALVTNYNNTTCGNPADINVDCKVNMLDFQALVKNYGFGT